MDNIKLLRKYRDQGHEALEWLDLAVQHLDEALEEFDALPEVPDFTDAEMNRRLADALELPARVAEIARRLLDNTRRRVIYHGLRTAGHADEGKRHDA